MKNAPATRAGVVPDRPAAQYVRFTEEQNRRLHETLREDGIPSVQVFIHTLVMKAIEESEEKRERRRQLLEQRRLERKRAIDPSRGLGLRERIREEQQASPASGPLPNESPAPPAPQVIISTQPAASIDADLDSLAAFVVKSGSDYEQHARMRTAVDVVTASSSSPEERMRRLRVLDEKVGKIKSSTGALGNLFSALENLIK
jgi:hypothetical protein